MNWHGTGRGNMTEEIRQDDDDDNGGGGGSGGGEAMETIRYSDTFSTAAVLIQRAKEQQSLV